MEQSTLEAISITALVISIIVFVVLVFNMLKGLFTHGGIVKMKGGDIATEYIQGIKNAIHNIPVAYSPDSDDYNNAIIRYASTHNMVLILYAVFSVLLLERRSPEERAAANKMFDICRNNLIENMNNDNDNDDNAEDISLISRTIDMLEAQRSGPIALREINALNDEWLDRLRRLARDPNARAMLLEE